MRIVTAAERVAAFIDKGIITKLICIYIYKRIDKQICSIITLYIHLRTFYYTAQLTMERPSYYLYQQLTHIYIILDNMMY